MIEYLIIRVVSSVHSLHMMIVNLIHLMLILCHIQVMSTEANMLEI